MTQTIAGMLVLQTPAEVREFVQQRRKNGQKIGLVPTMGALHAGHMSLVDLAREHAQVVVLTIFVNPLQFGVNEDLSKYPRQLQADCALCVQHGVDAVYAPDVATMYPPGFQTNVQVAELTHGLCGASRPTHFAGVTTVVTKLLNIAMADVAVFGEKDYQQLAVLRRMARDLDHPTRILGAPIAREIDGLAMSSRNVYLSEPERERAPGIHRALRALQDRVASGAREVGPLQSDLHAALGRVGAVDYAEIVDADGLTPLALLDRPARAIVAVWVGKARLLDNVPLLPSPTS